MDIIERVCVFGAGTLGWQIALQCASHAHTVNLYDLSPVALRNAEQHISNELESWVNAGSISAEAKESTVRRIRFESDPKKAVKGVDLVIEAVPEKLELKRKVFRELDAVCDADTIISTNSSSIRVSLIEDATRRMDRVLNTHFYSNLWRSRIVELMKGRMTSDETMTRVGGFMRSIGMLPLVVRKESTGFIFNRVWRAVKRECLHLVDDGVASYEDVDRAWMSYYGTKMGPFGLMDKVGLDVVRDIENVYYGESGDPRDAPPRLLLDKIERGELGVKTGRGFYSYPNPAFLDPSFLEP
ncbi:MAG: 3-hydroxyacyl-CoA dehydrogenase family protein [Candidatus Bathyarchaeia archaeon]